MQDNNKNQKFWLVLMTQNREKDIQELIENTRGIFDGIVAVVNQPSNDKTLEILEQNKGEGKIITRPFVRHHGHMMNEILLAGVIKNLDYFLILDSSDRLGEYWRKNLKEDIKYWMKNQVGGVYLDRLFIARYIDGMTFNNDVHWGVNPIYGQSIDLSKINGYKKESYIINTRGKTPESHARSAIENPIKYFVEYNHGYSHLQLLYQQFGNDVFNYHVQRWLEWRIYCEKELGLELTVNNLTEYYKKGIQNKDLPDFIVGYTELEQSLKDLIRYYILKQDLMGEIVKNRFCWSFQKFYFNGEEHQNKNDDYWSAFNSYRKQQGRERE